MTYTITVLLPDHEHPIGKGKTETWESQYDHNEVESFYVAKSTNHQIVLALFRNGEWKRQHYPLETSFIIKAIKSQNERLPSNSRVDGNPTDPVAPTTPTTTS